MTTIKNPASNTGKYLVNGIVDKDGKCIKESVRIFPVVNGDQENEIEFPDSQVQAFCIKRLESIYELERKGENIEKYTIQ